MVDIINKYIKQTTDKFLDLVDNKIDQMLHEPAKTSLDAFRGNLSSGIARPNQFMFNVTLPDFLRPSLLERFSVAAIMASQGLAPFEGKLSLLCFQVELGAKKFNNRTVKSSGMTRRVPQNYNWDTVTCSFIDTNEHIVYNTMSDWMDGINHPVTNTGVFPDEYETDMRVDLLNRKNSITAYAALNGAYPVSLSRSTLNWGSLNTFMVTTVEFSYTYQNNKDYSSLQLYNALNNLTDGAFSKLLGIANDAVNTFNPATLLKNSINADRVRENPYK